jgi:hypothetical protein
MTCSICLMNLDRPLYQHGVCLPCKHWFHSQCINEWWGRILTKSCPYCRRAPDQYWEDLRYQTDSMIIRFGMKHTQIGLMLDHLFDIYLWLMTEKQLDGEYTYIKGLIKAGSFDVLQNLILESINSLVARDYFRLENGIYRYIA